MSGLPKYSCSECGRQVTLREGHTTTCAGFFPTYRFVCNRCQKKFFAAMERTRQARFKPQEQDLAHNYVEEENAVMLEILREIAPSPSWVKLVKINKLFRAKSLQQPGSNTRYVSHILARLGFNKKQRRGGGYVWVYIGKNES